MEIDKVKKLEKDKGFKRSFFGKLVWRKYALVPPALVLFVSLFGVVYMYNTDRLISYYCLPFIVFLLLSTIWFKSTRKYLIKQDVDRDDEFAICLVLPLLKERGNQYYLFSTGANRLNKYFLEKAKAEILESKDKYLPEIERASKTSFLRLEDMDICVVSNLKIKRNLFPVSSKHTGENRYLVYYGEDKVKSISEKDIMRFL